ncbi:MAG TPA: nicotinamide-nucleotide amidase [Usitatibacter sp.]|nr:nicotinamide-nucleotide amidase [Usitatibacter sp.]
MTDADILRLARKLGRECKARRIMVATAESCTGGGVAEAITAISGSSEWFDRGFVTYSNEAKQDLLGVSIATLRIYGAVSEEVAREMAAGALAASHAQASVAVTGIAGPGGGSAEKPVGTVWFAWASDDGAIHAERHRFKGGRAAVRRQSVQVALEGLLDQVE